MTRTTNSIILVSDIWADTGDTTSPPFAPTIGWDSTYSAPGGNVVDRTLMNYNFNQLTALGYDINRYGGNLSWDTTILYEIGAIILGSDNIRYISSTQNSGNDPTFDAGVNWTPVSVTFSNDANVTINTDVETNTVTIGLTEDLSNKADVDLSNVAIASFAAKLKDGQYTYKEIDGSQVKINVYEILTDASITFSANVPGKQMTFGTSVSLASLRSNYDGPAEPSPTVSGQFWNSSLLKTLYIRNQANTDWVTVSNSDSFVNTIPTGSYAVSSLDNSRTYTLLNFGTGAANPVTLNLPAFSSVDNDFRMDIISYDNSDITINAFGGENLNRSGGLVSSVTVTGQQNSIFSIIKLDADEFYFVGAESALNASLSNINDTGRKVILDLTMPVGTIWTTAVNTTPPMSGILGVTWALISSGRTITTTGLTSGGREAGVQALNSTISGSHSTDNTSLSVSQMPSHNHTMQTAPRWAGGNENGNKNGPWKALTDKTVFSGTGFNGMISETSNSTGSGSGHSHTLNVKTYEVITYRRMT